MNRYLDTPAGPLHVRDYGGSGPPMVLVHGLGGSIANWDAFAPRLTGHGRVLALDLPGFGLSPPASDWKLATHARAIREFVLTLPEPVILIGNSMGGLLSEMAASGDPPLVRALLLIAPATPPRLPDPKIHWPTAFRLAVQATPGLGSAVTRYYLSRLSAEEMVELTVGNIVHHPDRVPPEVMEEFTRLAEVRSHLPWAEVAVPLTGRSIARYFRKPSRFVSMIRGIRAPTLVVQGIHDHIVSPTSVEWMCSLRPDWRFVAMDDTGHTPQLDAADRLVDVVLPWLETALEREISA